MIGTGLAGSTGGGARRDQVDGDVISLAIDGQQAEQVQRFGMIRMPGKDLSIRSLGLRELPVLLMLQRPVTRKGACCRLGSIMVCAR